MPRSKRFSKTDLHPLVLEATERWQRSMMSGTTSVANGIPKKDMEVYQEHQKVWWKEYGAAFALGSVAWIGWFGGAIALASMTDIKAFAAAGLVLGVGGATAHCIWAYRKNVATATVHELKALRPVIAENVRPEYLRELTLEYLDAFIAVEQSNALGEDTRKEAREQIYELATQARRVYDQMESLRAMEGDTLIITEMQQDVDQLRAKLEQTSDPEARETYASALRIAEGRLARLGGAAPMLERCEAQLAMIRQTLAFFRETLGRTTATGGAVGLDFTMLRQQVEAVQQQSNGLDAAFAELDQLRA